jgi:putative NIF3 family GTP cyclohydrolase 1 type 2
MKASDILEHFLSRADWIDRGTTVDRIIAGDLGTDVDRCLVTWMPSFGVLRLMVDRGFRMLVCHEPTFWNHGNDRPILGDPLGQEKMAYIQDHGIIIIRIHDCWDRWPEVGIPWAWAEFLGLGNQPKRISKDGYQHRYDIDPIALGIFTRHMAERCKEIREPMVQLTGDPYRMISRIGIGTGCGCDIPTYQAMDCDCSIVCDDGSCYWQGIQKAEDGGHPIIRVNHGTSEEPGMLTLTKYINSQLDGLRAEHLPHGSTFKLVGTGINLNHAGADGDRSRV